MNETAAAAVTCGCHMHATEQPPRAAAVHLMFLLHLFLRLHKANACCTNKDKLSAEEGIGKHSE